VIQLRGRDLAAKIVIAALTAFRLEVQAAEPASTAPSHPFAIRWTELSNTNKTGVEVSGLSRLVLEKLRQANWKTAQWQQLLSVYAEQGHGIADVELPAMLGAYSVQSELLRFEPQFPLEPGLTYRAVFRPNQLPGESSATGGVITAVYQVRSRATNPVTEVTQIYPSAEMLPENLLKFYVHFSAPMSRGHIYDHIHLRNETGKEIELPFLEIDEELWNPTMTRLTLFIDPGRIKREVRPLEEVGPALEAGKRYTLAIDREWKDGSGVPLKDNFQKVFKVGPPDRDPLEPARWHIRAPEAGTHHPLSITFLKPMDHALAQRVIQVTDESGKIVQGKVALEDFERRWTFTPTHHWHRGPHRIVVQTTLEDLAGNNIGKPFEVDLFESVQRRFTNSAITLPFEAK
jgi:hypothetical protein